ncbi:MAG: hypothetical protein FD141_365 [Fusobacteria bacterium]|nr:MAG: hypothetical protein FD141_365 [Fusobacteriota bacterium]KAF0228970.1 MAG: hypothetical protein FD182_1226 [Fusobacteriota bacterium]
MLTTIEQKSELLKYNFDVEKFNNKRELLLALDELIANIGFNDKDEVNDKGIELTKLYDAIYSQN